MRTLLSRLILSHVLPLLIIIPLLGIVLIYTIETRIVLPNLLAELTDQARLIAETAHDYPDIWQNSGQAEIFTTRFGTQVHGSLMLLDGNGQLLASSDSDNGTRPGQQFDPDVLRRVLAGGTVAQTHYNQRIHTEIADVLIPVIGANNHVLGIVRLSHQLSDVYARFIELRYLIAGVLLPGLLLGLVVGTGIALTLMHPITQMYHAVSGLVSGQHQTLLTETGPIEVRLLIRSFNTLLERMRTLEETRRRLLANVVHELGRPLGALHSALQALQRGADTDVALRRELLGGMDTEIQSMRRLLDDLAHLRDQLVGSLELERKPIALQPWLVGLLAPWREVAQTKGITWHTAIPTALPTLSIDPERLSQALGNILSNAIKYTPSGGTVSITADATADEVWVRVCDTGPGISLEDQTHIFKPFYRLHAGQRFPQGMGLGLSIARDIIVAHSGRIDVQSASGQGSSFILWLPTTSPHTAAASRSSMHRHTEHPLSS